MRGLFIKNSQYASINFEDYANKGITDIFCNGSEPTTHYNNCLSELRNVINACSNTDLNIWWDCSAFLKANGTWTNPTDIDQLSLMSTLIDQILTELPTLKGVTFDDYNYQPSLWPLDGDTLTTPNNEYDLALQHFANTIKTVVHSHGKQLGAFVPAWDIYGFCTSSMCKIFDFISPEIYKNNVLPIENTDVWIQNMIQSHQTNMNGYGTLIPALITLDIDGINSRSATDMFGQMSTALNCGVDYILFNQSHLASDCAFPKWKTKMIGINMLVKIIE